MRPRNISCGSPASPLVTGDLLCRNPGAAPSPQALPRLTHMAIRLPETSRLAQPHTALRSLTLIMTWPVHLATLLPGLPNLEVVRADVFLYA